MTKNRTIITAVKSDGTKTTNKAITTTSNRGGTANSRGGTTNSRGGTAVPQNYYNFTIPPQAQTIQGQQIQQQLQQQIQQRIEQQITQQNPYNYASFNPTMLSQQIARGISNNVQQQQAQQPSQQTMPMPITTQPMTTTRQIGTQQLVKAQPNRLQQSTIQPNMNINSCINQPTNNTNQSTNLSNIPNPNITNQNITNQATREYNTYNQMNPQLRQQNIMYSSIINGTNPNTNGQVAYFNQMQQNQNGTMIPQQINHNQNSMQLTNATTQPINRNIQNMQNIDYGGNITQAITQSIHHSISNSFNTPKYEKGSEVKTIKEDRKDRYWKLVEKDATLFKNEEPIINVYTKHQREQPHQALDEKLYSSLRYQIELRISSDGIDAIMKNILKQLKAPYNEKRTPNSASEGLDALWKVDDEHEKLVMSISIHSKINGKIEKEPHPPSVFKNNNKAILDIDGKRYVTGTVIAQVDSQLSFHFKREDYVFYLELTHYKGSEPKRIICKLQSPVFRLFARKPNKKQYSRIKKKKQKELEEALAAAMAAASHYVPPHMQQQINPQDVQQEYMLNPMIQTHHHQYPNQLYQPPPQPPPPPPNQ